MKAFFDYPFDFPQVQTYLGVSPMAASYNRVVLVGNLTRDPECRYIPSGTAVSDIGMAVNDRRKTPTGEWVDETTFIDITLWGRQAEIVSEYCSKGSSILVEGRLKLDTWEAEGQKRSKLKVIGEKIQLLSPSTGSKGGGSGSGGGGGGGGQARPQQQSAPQSYDDMVPPTDGDEIPF